MDYQKIYNQLIVRAQTENRKRIKGGTYYEKHHIIPKCIDITLAKEKSNLVLLTAREHFLSHWMLVRIHPGNKKLIYAWWRMCCTNTKAKKSCKGIEVQGSIYVPNSRVFEECKVLNARAKSESYSGIIKGPRSEEVKQKCREKMLGRATSVQKGDKRPGLHNEQSKQKLRAARALQVFSDATRLKMSNSAKKPKERKPCPHCGKSVARNGSGTKHIEFCKNKSYEEIN